MKSLFSERLKSMREKLNLTQEEVAEGIKTGKSTISQYETGKRKADYETMKSIAEFFGVSGDYFLGLVDDPYKKFDGTEIQSPSRLSGAVREYFSNQNIQQDEKDNMFKEITSLYWKYKK